MLIRSVDRTGEPVLFTPRDALPFALQKGMKLKNTLDRIYWVMIDGLTVDSFSSLNTPADATKKKDKGGWQASATGKVDIGYTDAKTDKFYDAKSYKFKIEYRSSKDGLGLPDIKVTSFEFQPLSNNPADKMRFEDLTLKKEVHAAKKMEAPIPEKKLMPAATSASAENVKN